MWVFFHLNYEGLCLLLNLGHYNVYSIKTGTVNLPPLLLPSFINLKLTILMISMTTLWSVQINNSMLPTTLLLRQHLNLF